MGECSFAATDDPVRSPDSAFFAQVQSHWDWRMLADLTFPIRHTLGPAHLPGKQMRVSSRKQWKSADCLTRADEALRLKPTKLLKAPK